MSDFFDLPAEERAAIYELAEEREGSSFYDLDAETRSYYYGMGEGR